MRHRPTLMDRAVGVVAKYHAQRVFDRFMAATRRAAAIQERVLLAKIRRNAESDFGRDHGFDHIHSSDEFVRRVPILTYEDHRPYIERVKGGDLRAMFGGRQRVLMFVLTSGTTDEPKYIPVTEDFLNEYRRGWNAFGIKALLDHPEALLRRIVQVSSRMDESRSPAGIPCGAITGLMAATQKRLVRKYYTSPECLGRIEDPTAKYYTTMRLAVPCDVAFLITASPATQLKLARTADEHHGQFIRDVHDGTLWAGLPVPPAVRAELAGRLKPDPAAGRRLERLAGEHGRLLPRHYWELAFIANWTAGSMGLYLQDFPEYFGEVPVRDVGLLASEGRISIPVEDGTPAGILEVTSHFFEFLPRDRADEASPPALRADQLEVGAEYFILLTTSSGLCRYRLGDLVRVTGFVNQAPVIEFLNKGEHTCSLAGEKLTERQVMLAMEQAAGRAGLPVRNFVLAPCWGHPPHYVLYIEPPVCPERRLQTGALLPSATPQAAGLAVATTGLSRGARSLAQLVAALDAQLQAVNVEYAGKRRSARLGPVRANALPPGFLAAWDRRESDRRRKGNEQYKHRYLFCHPGEDAEFTTPAPRTAP